MLAAENSLIKAVILATGRELLTGRVQDTNSNWLCMHLFEIGIKVIRVEAVDDDPDAIAVEVRRAISDGAGVIVTTGGLGPTPDDMTIRCVAAVGSYRLVRSARALEMIAARYRRLVEIGRLKDASINEDRAHMADIPEGAGLLVNSVGTAPGVDFFINDTRVFCLPGPPSEMVPMAESCVLPVLRGLVHGTIRRLTIEIAMYDESHVAALIRAMQPAYPSVHFKPEPGVFDGRRVMRVHLEAAGDDERQVSGMLDSASVDLARRALAAVSQS